MMKNYCLSAVAAVLLLSAGGFRADYAQESSKETAIVESDHAVFPDGLKLTLEVCPTEIYMGDVVFLALWLENASDKTFDNFASIEDRLKSGRRLGRISVSCSQLENEYAWSPDADAEARSALAMDLDMSLRGHSMGGGMAFSATMSSPSPADSRRKPFQPGEKLPLGKEGVQLPPFEEWNDPFWKELRANLSPEGIVCAFQVVQYFELNTGEQRREVFTLNIRIKPRPEDETRFIERLSDVASKKRLPDDRGVEKTVNTVSPPQNDDSVVVNGIKYNLSRFVRTTASIRPFLPNNQTALDDWRALDAKFRVGTLRDDVTFTRLLLEYFEADADAAETPKKELIDWLEALPEIQKSFFAEKIVLEGASFFCQTPLAGKSRALLHAVYDSLDDKWKILVYNVDRETYRKTPLTPPEGYDPPPTRWEQRRPTEEEIANGARTLKDGCRMWFYQGVAGEEIIAAKIIRLNEKTNEVILKDRFGYMISLDFAKFSKEDQEYILEYHNLEL